VARQNCWAARPLNNAWGEQRTLQTVTVPFSVAPNLQKYELYMALTLCHLVLQVITFYAEHKMCVFFSTRCAQYESNENQKIHSILKTRYFRMSTKNIKRQKHLVTWVKRDQLDATCFIIIFFSAQHVSVVNTSILRGLRRIPHHQRHTATLTPTYVEPDTTHEVTQRISRKLLRMDVLTSETCWALNNEIIEQVASSWSLFTQISRWCTVQ